MNSITLTLLVVIATVAAIASLVLALAIARAQEGYEDKAGFHRGLAPVYVSPAKAWIPASRARKNAGRKRGRVADPVSIK